MSKENQKHPSDSEWSDKDKESILWLYLHGLSIEVIAVGKKWDFGTTAGLIAMVLQGKEPFAPHWSDIYMENTDWTGREEYVLRYMRQWNRSPADVSAILGRSKESVKRHWKEMLAADEVLRQYKDRKFQERIDAITGDLDTPKAPAKKPTQSGFGFQ